MKIRQKTPKKHKNLNQTDPESANRTKSLRRAAVWAGDWTVAAADDTQDAVANALPTSQSWLCKYSFRGDSVKSRRSNVE